MHVLEFLINEDLENMKSALFYDYMDSVETYKWASPISLNEYNNCSNFNPKNIIKKLKIKLCKDCEIEAACYITKKTHGKKINCIADD